MRISATITNRMVRNNSLPERLMRKFRAGRGSVDAEGSLAGSVSGSNTASTKNSQPTYDAPHPGARQTRREEVDRRALADFRQCWIGNHDIGDSANDEPLRNRQRPGRNHLAGLRAHDCCSYYFTIRFRYDFYVAVRFVLDLGAVI